MQNVSSEEALVETGGNWSTIDPPKSCRLALHNKPFLLRHSLADHPLFSLQSLTCVAEEWGRTPGHLHMDAGDVALGDRFCSAPSPRIPVSDVIAQIDTAKAFILVQHLQTHPLFRPLVEEFSAFVRDLVGPPAEKFLQNPNFLFIISSPLRKTSYHFDEEVNFLMQVHGEKSLWLCDPADRAITTEEELERFYGGDMAAGVYKPDAAETAAKFILKPGQAVHIPTHGAHWVENHNNVSVTTSIYYKFPRSERADVYKFNNYLRRLGLSPTPLGRSPFIDDAKRAVMGTARKVRNTLFC